MPTKLRVPHPPNFFTRGVDGRIDDPDAGWKGRGLWANYGSNTLWHAETGKGTLGAVVHFQMRRIRWPDKSSPTDRPHHRRR